MHTHTHTRVPLPDSVCRHVGSVVRSDEIFFQYGLADAAQLAKLKAPPPPLDAFAPMQVRRRIAIISSS